MTPAAAAQTITLAPKLILPLEIVTRRVAVLGGSGMGKTSTAVLIAEQLRALGIQVVIVDPTGAWWGIAHNAAGDGPGADLTVLGGEHGAAPLSREAGRACARLVAQEGLSAVLDIDRPYLTSWGARQHFVADFLSDLYELCRSRIVVIIDEAHRFAPQNIRDEGSDAARCLGALSDVVALGRRRGLDVILVTQRMAKLNKDVLELCQVLIAHQLRGNNDRAALKGWLDNAGGDLKAIMASIGRLQRGEAWVSAPQYDVDRAYLINPKTTFDSSADASAGAEVTGSLTSEVDVAKIAALLADTIAEVRADDPRALHDEIDRLRAQLEASSNGHVAEPEIRYVTIGEQALADLAHHAASAAKMVGERASQIRDELDRQATAIAEDLHDVAARAETERQALTNGQTSLDHETARPDRPDPPGALRGVEVLPSSPAEGTRRPSGPAAQKPSGRPDGLQGDLLDAIAAYPAELTTSQAALIVGKQADGGYFRRQLKQLREAGLIDGMAATSAGHKLAAHTITPTRCELVTSWRARLDGMERDLFDLIAEQPGRNVSELAERLGKSPDGGYFRRQLAALRKRGLIVNQAGYHLHPDFDQISINA